MGSDWPEGVWGAEWADLVVAAVRPVLDGAGGRRCDVRVCVPPGAGSDGRMWSLRARLGRWEPDVYMPMSWSWPHGEDLVEVLVRVAEDVALGVDWVESHTVVLRPPGMDDEAFAIYERLRLDGTEMSLALEASELLQV